MGCFSFICKKTKEPILSSSFTGDAVHLFLLKDGKVIEKMYGNYDSYGRVFGKDGESLEWEMDWGDVVDLMFDGDPESGIAAILDIVFTGEVPTEKSEDDPNQGWDKGKNINGFSPKQIQKKVKNPKHEVFPNGMEVVVKEKPIEEVDENVLVSNVLNDTKAYDKIGKALGIEMDNDSTIFHEIEEFIVERFKEM